MGALSALTSALSLGASLGGSLHFPLSRGPSIDFNLASLGATATPMPTPAWPQPPATSTYARPLISEPLLVEAGLSSVTPSVVGIPVAKHRVSVCFCEDWAERFRGRRAMLLVGISIGRRLCSSRRRICPHKALPILVFSLGEPCCRKTSTLTLLPRTFPALARSSWSGSPSMRSVLDALHGILRQTGRSRPEKASHVKGVTSHYPVLLRIPRTYDCDRVPSRVLNRDAKRFRQRRYGSPPQRTLSVTVRRSALFEMGNRVVGKEVESKDG